MKKKSRNYFQCFRKNLLVFSMRALVFSSVTVTFGMSPSVPLNVTIPNNLQQQSIKGIITDAEGMAIPGVTVMEKGTSNGTITDFDGAFTIVPSHSNAVIVFSSVGYKSQEIKISNQTVLNISLEEDVSALDEVIVVGYGTRTKTTVTSSVSQVGSETFENRAIQNVSNGLQGAVTGLQITNSTSGGEPGATQNINIRGLMTANANGTGIDNAGPLVLVDGAVMDLNDINPEDIETVTVLKDAAAAAIYGSRAAGGAVLITTKSGKNMDGGMVVNYSNNFAFSTYTKWPNQPDALTYATVMNEAGFNNTGRTNVFFSEDAIDRIRQNIEDPGSAPTLVTKNNGQDWDVGSGGLYASGNTNWRDFLFDTFAQKTKHNLSFRGGNEKINYYISAGAYSEDGLFKIAENSFDRYNLDSKIAVKPTNWLSFELLTKVQRSESVFPWDPNYGRGRVFDQLSKLKPTMPTVDPIYGEPLAGAYYPIWQHSSETNTNNQLALLPRIVIEPIKDWRINIEYNYRKNNNKRVYSTSQYETIRPNGDPQVIISKDQTRVSPTLYTNDYWSPNIYTSYHKSIGDHSFDITAGYQNERYDVYDLSANAYGLLSDNVTAISTAVGDQTVSDDISHWSTESVFARVGYNYKEKYLARVTYRRDGSSKFEPGNRWAGFPSFELGYNIAKEDFWPLEDVSMFKLRATSGSLGNQNTANYLYVPRIPVSDGFFLFNGEREYTANVPDLTSTNLTWETVKTKDIGFDLLAFNNKLGFSFDWYRSDTEGMSTGGASLPAVLGTSSPRVNGGISRTQGWEAELNWQQSFGDFRYNVRATLSDYKQSIVEYPNQTKLLSDFYTGRDLGEVWGLTWEGWFESDQEALDRESVVNQRWVHNSQFGEGDTKYKDINGDGVINNGSNTVDDHGDLTVIANTTPRYQFGLTLGASYKGFDYNMFIQGVGKRDYSPLTGNLKKQFLGPNQGPFHSNVYEEHLDYYRPEDTDSPLGANTDSYLPRPYATNGGKNNRNFRTHVDRYIQNAAYARLKTIQLGYTIPKEITSKYNIDRFRIYVTGENLLTFTDLMFYDPESLQGTFSGGVSYPLSKTFSTGVNIAF